MCVSSLLTKTNGKDPRNLNLNWSMWLCVCGGVFELSRHSRNRYNQTVVSWPPDLSRSLASVLFTFERAIWPLACLVIIHESDCRPNITLEGSCRVSA